MWPNPQVTRDLIKLTKEILNGKLHFMCSDIISFESEEKKQGIVENRSFAEC